MTNEAEKMQPTRKQVVKNGKALRCGYTTGSCATAVATACTQMLLSRQPEHLVTITLPNREQVFFMLEDVTLTKKKASCWLTKDAGDDPDVTDGIKIGAEVTLGGEGIRILGGEGIGVVTAKGLACKVGEPAINPVPKAMILENVTAVCQELGYSGGLKIVISAPEGVALAKRTFNPRLGIVGGISILGTTGIVEPMSERALVDTIKLLIDKQSLVDGEHILVTPGNYGKEFCKEQLQLDIDQGIKCSNFIGETFDYLVYKGFRKVLLVGHIGKLVKVAGGIMNTHSSVADCRMEILAAHAALAGASQPLVAQIMACLTTDTALELIEAAGFGEQVLQGLVAKILWQLQYRVKGALEVGVVLFSQGDRLLAKSANAESLLSSSWEENNLRGCEVKRKKKDLTQAEGHFLEGEL